MASGVAGVALFVYGTLQDGTRVHALTGRRFATIPARLDGFRRVTGPAGYPTVVPCAGESVTGLVLEDVDPASLRALDAYEDEGRLYHRRPGTVTSGDRAVVCELYVAIPSP